MRLFWVAASFLTTFPTPRLQTYLPGDLGRSAAWFSMVGLLIGAVLALVGCLVGFVFQPALAAVIVVTSWAWITGGLHLDGLADCFDGLPAAASPQRRLEIMKDPRLGTFGGIGLFLFLLLKVTAVSALPSQWMIMALVAAPVLARWSILWVARQPPAHQQGLGAEFSREIKAASILYAAVLPALSVVWIVILAGPIRAALVSVLLATVFLIVVRTARARLGGITGDVMGLVVECSELVVLLALAIRPSGLLS